MARVLNLQGGASSAQAAVMIRETLGATSTDAFVGYQGHYIYFWDQPTTGASTAYQSTNVYQSLPRWMVVVRNGNTFTGYTSSDGVNWAQVGSSVTISMAQNVYVGLAVSSDSTSSLAAAAFDSVSISSTASPAPVITSVSATTGSAGNEIAITGSGFGAPQGSSLVMSNDTAVTINSWSAASILVTIPSGATSGPLVVSVAPSMNDSNAIDSVRVAKLSAERIWGCRVLCVFPSRKGWDFVNSSAFYRESHKLLDVLRTRPLPTKGSKIPLGRSTS